MKSKSQKSTVNHKVALSQKPYTSGISLQRNVVEVIPSDTESDNESQNEESELCCVCHKFSHPNLKEQPYLKIVNWVSCEKWDIACADPGIFVTGGPGQSNKKSSDNGLFVFLVLSLFYRSQMVNFKEIYHFSRFQRGSKTFQGGVQLFPGGGPIAYSL